MCSKKNILRKRMNVIQKYFVVVAAVVQALSTHVNSHTHTFSHTQTVNALLCVYQPISQCAFVGFWYLWLTARNFIKYVYPKQINHVQRLQKDCLFFHPTPFPSLPLIFCFALAIIRGSCFLKHRIGSALMRKSNI